MQTDGQKKQENHLSCLVVVNQDSGGANRRALNKAIADLQGRFCRVEVQCFHARDGEYDLRAHAQGFDAVAVCGGDGTLHHALNALRGSPCTLFYLPCGTMNDLAHTLHCRRGKPSADCMRRDLGEWNGVLFGYVAAAGSFTPLGYSLGPDGKQKLGRMAYYLRAFREYKRCRIRATLQVDDVCMQGEYTLVMALNSRYVFGLSVHRAYRPDEGRGWLLLIDTPRGRFWRIPFFLRFFRAFFVGFKGEVRGKHLRFLPYHTVKMISDTPLTFCVDGERYDAGRVHRFTVWGKGEKSCAPKEKNR